MFKEIKENKILFFTCIIVFLILVYCSFNTFLSNDDLPYSFFYRTNTRVTNIIQVFKNQVADYFNISSRVFVHMMVQFLLIFGKNLWAVLNPFVIIINFLLINRIVKTYLPKSNNLINFIISSILFLLLFRYKWLFYWVAGSVNYIWTSTILLLFINYYLNKGWSKNIYLNLLIILFVSILHESLLIFMIFFIIFDILYEKIIKKTITKNKFLFFIPLLISIVFLLFGPGTFSRINSNNTWSNLSIFEKLALSIPVVSKNLFNLRDIKNILPIVYLILLLISLLKSKLKYKNILIIFLILISSICLFTNNGWFYFILVVLIFLIDSYYNIFEEREKNVIIHLSMLAIVFSMIITNDYANSRPNYFYYLYLIYSSVILFNQLFEKINYKRILPCLYVLLLVLLLHEAIVYNKIGRIHEVRLDQIKQAIENKNDVLYLKKIPSKFSLYHIDTNEPSSKDYFAYKYYIDYYKLNDKIVIEFVE